MFYKKIIRPLLFQLDAEQAHDVTHKIGIELSDNSALLSVVRATLDQGNSGLNQDLFGLEFESPVGLAAGFDKNGHLMALMQALGFGFVEVGSITALPSSGNPKPRLIRLPKDQALINRMGLNNDGAEIITKRVKRAKDSVSIPIGINIAKTHNPKILGDAAIHDYITSFKLAETSADYLTINISCPNTEEGKTFEDPVALKELIDAINSVKSSSCPVLMKLSADLNFSELETLIDLCESGNVDGYVLTNTSSKRANLQERSVERASTFGKGGLSGNPLYFNMIELVGHTYRLTHGSKSIIAVGGIDSPQKALHAIQHGASLVQTYTGLVYEGPFLIHRINRYLQKELVTLGVKSLNEIRGTAL